jgi:D-glycero-alpha-D-manno-heptose 1-phosphate guanylyltransferase
MDRGKIVTTAGKAMEAIILAGGFGTRLKSVIADIPKPMAPVRGKPFLDYLLRHCVRQGVSRIILSVGYRYEAIKAHFGARFLETPLLYSVEDAPLGTGGAVAKALRLVDEGACFVVNGDSFFNVDLAALYKFHRSNNADFSIALKKLTNFERYGVVRRNGGRIVAFEEKKFVQEGEINGGVYVLEKELFTPYGLPDKFSLEKDFLEKQAGRCKIYGFESEGYFIDIGIPEDYERAQKELPDSFSITP